MELQPNRNKLYEELGWESLSDRRWYSRLFHFYKITHNMAPTYLSDSIPRHRRPLYGNANSETFYEIYCRSSQYLDSFFPNTIKTWNAIGNELQSCPSLVI